jgi:hypothetical protein
LISLIWGITNSTTSPTLNINSSADWPILREDGSALEVGDLRETVPSQLLWNDGAWLLLGTATAAGSGVSSFNSRAGAVTLLSADVTDALGFQPVDLAGDTFSGPIVLSGNATTSLMPTTLQQVLSLIASIPSVTGVSSFNSRTGAVSLTGTDVTNALTYSPVQTFNSRSGAVTLTSGDVTGALTYTPVNKAGDTMSGTLNGLDASFKRFIPTGVAQTMSATLDFSVNQTIVVTVTGAQVITAVSGLPTEGNAGVVIFKATGAGAVTFGSAFQWKNDDALNLAGQPEKKAIVYVRRIGTEYFISADVF